MDPDRGTGLLGGLSPAAFMRRHWQKKPLLIRAALPAALPAMSTRRLFALAARDDVESRLVVRSPDDSWRVRPGPLPRRALPPLRTPGWSLLVQGVDLHDDAARGMLERFRFVPDARLDDLMISFATDGGGVGPHVDSYDVFLLQLRGIRRWRIGRTPRPLLREGVPLKMLAGFAPDAEWELGPGDMLYLPPGWGHDGCAVGECMTASIGFRAPGWRELAADTLQRLADAAREDDDADTAGTADNSGAAGAVDAAAAVGSPGTAIGRRLYRDPRQPATAAPARVPAALERYADAAISRLLADRTTLRRALGEVLSEPKAGTWFERRQDGVAIGAAVGLDRRTRMLYDDRHVFINGEAFRACGRDAVLMRRLADARRLAATELASLSAPARALVRQWLEAGWLQGEAGPGQNGAP